MQGTLLGWWRVCLWIENSALSHKDVVQKQLLKMSEMELQVLKLLLFDHE